MWFLITKKSPAKFYVKDGGSINVEGIEWTNEIIIENSGVFTRISSSDAFVKDHQQAMSVLSKTQVLGYRTKVEARVFGKTLPNGKWKYLKLTSIEKFVKSEMKKARI